MAYMKIKPTDTLFFGSGKPFNAGSDSWTDNSFLPNPSVIWGTMFSVLFCEGKVTVADKKKLQIKNIYLYNEKQTTLLIPTPLDIFVDSDGKKYISKYKDVDFISNYSLPHHLYRIDLTQFHNEWSFLIEYESEVVFNQNGILKLGGEGKTAQYSIINEPIGFKSAKVLEDNILKELESKNYFKVLFTTPTYFKCGWQPEQEGLLCANVGKAISIGGWKEMWQKVLSTLPTQ